MAHARHRSGASDAIAQVGPGGSPWPADSGDGGALLATAVSWNVVLSACSGLLLGVGGWVLDGWLGVNGWVLTGMGVGLLVFAGVLVWLLSEPLRLAAGARWVVVADIGWIVGAVVLLAGFPSAMSTAGRVALAAVSLGVTAIVVGQLAGLGRHPSGPATATSPIELRVERIVSAPTERVWKAIADAGDYARFAPGIAETRLVSGDGHGMVRVCTDERGGQWNETCTLWDEGRRYRMTVDVASYPAYYRMLLQDFAQTWSVEPAGDRTRVTLVFEGSVKLGVIGRFAARVLGNRRRLEAILDSYERELIRAPRPI